MKNNYKDKFLKLINHSANTLAIFSAMYFVESSLSADNFTDVVRYSKISDHPTIYNTYNYDQFISNYENMLETKPLQILYFMYNEHFDMHDGTLNCTVDFFDYDNMSYQTCFVLLLGSYPEAFLDIVFLYKRGIFKLTEEIDTDDFFRNLNEMDAARFRFISRAMKNIRLLNYDENDQDLILLKNLLLAGLLNKRIGMQEKNILDQEIDSDTKLREIINGNIISGDEHILLAIANDNIEMLDNAMAQGNFPGKSRYRLSIDIASASKVLLSYADLAALSGSFNCFKFLVLAFSDTPTTKICTHMSLIGGNKTIINLCNENYNGPEINDIDEIFGTQGISNNEIITLALDNDIAWMYDNFIYSIFSSFPSLDEIKRFINSESFHEDWMITFTATMIAVYVDVGKYLGTYDYMLKLLTSKVPPSEINNVFDKIYIEASSIRERHPTPKHPVFKLLSKYSINYHSTARAISEYLRNKQAYIRSLRNQ